MWDYVGSRISAVSTLSDGEYALLLASLEAKLEPKKFHCGTCLTQYGNSEKLIAKTERNRKSKGCFDFTSKQYRIDNILYNSCIGNFVTPIDYFVEAFSLYEKGVLPFEGNLGDQPSKIMEIFQIIDVRRTEKYNQNKPVKTGK